MLQLITEGKFEKDLAKAKKQGKNIKKFKEIVALLVHKKPLPQKNRNHKLKGEFKDCWECHIEPDWLLIYKKTPTSIILSRMGSHSELF